jgi:threonine dehydrogenase-like Zn-dependent dehydrogenase
MLLMWRPYVILARREVRDSRISPRVSTTNERRASRRPLRDPAGIPLDRTPTSAQSVLWWRPCAPLAAGDVRIEDVPDPSIVEPTDAIVRVTRACICGSDLWPYASLEPAFYKNLTIGGGPAPVRAYIKELLPDILDGRIEPGKVFDRTVGLEGVPDGYRAMADRESIKVMVKP